MKRIIIIVLLVSSVLNCFAQIDSFDLVIYKKLDSWQKKDQNTVRTLSFVNGQDKSWCRLSIYTSTVSKGSIEADFESEWKELAATPYKITDAPEKSPVEEGEGWKIISGSGKFPVNNGNAAVIVTTFSGYNRCVSIVATTTDKRYLDDVINFIGSIELKKPTSANMEINASTVGSTAADIQQGNNGFAFTTTNFDDGWTSLVKDDWVAVTKGEIKVLLHYPKEGTMIAGDPEPVINNAWNMLVAPRYSDLKNYKTTYINTYNRPYLGTGFARENSSGKVVFIVLYRQGDSGWIEFISPDKNSFVREFKFDPEMVQWDTNSDLLNPLYNMKGYNKFAVAASDFRGKWTSDFSGFQQMYHIYTGLYAGMNIHQSNEEFVFNGNTYSWKLLSINGMAGNARYDQVASSGNFTVPNNWQISFTKIEKGPKTYHAFWSCIKGARVLNLLDVQSSGSGIYTQFGLSNK